MNIFLSISLNMCFECSNKPSHRDGSFEYPQHMFWLRYKKYNFQVHTLIWGPGLLLKKQSYKGLSCLLFLQAICAFYPQKPIFYRASINFQIQEVQTSYLSLEVQLIFFGSPTFFCDPVAVWWIVKHALKNKHIYFQR